MKNYNFYCFLFLIIPCCCVFSQPPNSGGRKPSGKENRPTENTNEDSKIFEESNVANLAGLVLLDSDIVLKEINSKNPTEKEIIKSRINAFNSEIEELKKSHQLLLESVQLNSITAERVAIAEKNAAKMLESRKIIIQKTESIRTEVVLLEKKLVSDFQSQLSEKSFRKFQKFLNNQKEKNHPKKDPKEELNYRDSGQKPIRSHNGMN